MKKTFGAAASIVSFLALASTPALSQSSNVGSSPDAASPEAAATGGAGSSFGGYIIEPSTSQSTATDYIGKSVYNAANESIGEVRDVVIDKTRGIVAVVVGVGGFLGVGEKNVAVPEDRIDVARDDENAGARLTTTETAETLKSAPEFVTSDAR
jgi:sporulation protein YlmC with PRC-barrel domain